MTRSVALFLILSFFLPPDCIFASTSTSDGLMTVTGKMSAVRLLSVSRTDTKVLQQEYSNAPDGMTFYFFFGRLPNATGLPSLAEPRDFLVNGTSYRTMTNTSLSRAYEPGTILDDLPAFLKQYPKFQSIIPPGFIESYALTVTIPGSPLIDDVQSTIVMELGWDNNYEKFEFPFQVPKRMSR